jgi:pyruvate formate lyase activating enzyme
MKEVYLYEKLDNKSARCKNCSHYCVIAPGKRGVCGVRGNINGTLFALNYGKAVSAQLDPVEKKPLFHFLPGTQTLSFATAGCNFICANCQNFGISQEPKKFGTIPGQDLPPGQIVALAKENDAPSISYTYVEPTIFSEYALDTMRLARAAGLKNIWVSNGFMSAESREMIIPYLDADNIDIKSFSDEFYKKNCGGRLQPVLDTCVAMKKAGVWLEITTLVIPTLSDDEKMLAEIAGFIARDLGKETPWHVTQFSGAISWKLKHLPETPAKTLAAAHEIGKKAGLKYVYTGNIPGLASDNTFCPKCGALCIERTGYDIKRHDISGKCPACNELLDIITNP